MRGEAAGLLVELVRTPSPSGQEEAAAAVLGGWASARGLETSVDDAAVRLVVGEGADGPSLLLASHLDTVPPGDGWTVDPYAGIVADGRLTARGAVDAKASVAAMAAAAAALAASGGPAAGRLVVLATYAEETRDTSMPQALQRFGASPDAAVVGEPTSLEPCIAQRGQLLLRLVWRGEQLHAGWAAERTPPPDNAIRLAARDLHALEKLRFERRHPTLGEVVVTPTLLEAGVARNVTPPRCEAVLDIRTTPEYSHAEVTAAVADRVAAEVEVISDRLVPAATPDGSKLLEAVLRIRPGARPFASPTCSDWVFLRHLDALKLGPGDSQRSHTADESIELAEVERAAQLYLELAREVLR
ncbi:MAG TPA: M20/M25/M40 family metallo-hydrolase [Chondromyces sp.]|nr:M20/M25/M40 family metallo-hydrolase [Chondromyces sp.]